jgi:hypothetical protein
MGSHILHDPHIDDTMNPCGFCLDTNSLCKIYLKRNGAIDVEKSYCPYVRNIRINQAKAFSITQPCTNHPLSCELCPENSVAIWKYNFAAHLRTTHGTAEPQNYTDVWGLHPNEKTLMLGVFDNRKRQRKSAQSSKKSQLLISDAHSSRLALRYVLFIQCNYCFLIESSSDVASEDDADDDDDEAEDEAQPDEEDLGASDKNDQEEDPDWLNFDVDEHWPLASTLSPSSALTSAITLSDATSGAASVLAPATSASSVVLAPAASLSSVVLAPAASLSGGSSSVLAPAASSSSVVLAPATSSSGVVPVQEIGAGLLDGQLTPAESSSTDGE